LFVCVSGYSAKRNELYKEFVEFTDTDKLKLLRYCSTRWLSLHTCILRMLNQWPALQAYFNSYEDETSVKVRDLAGYLNDPEIKFDFLFLSAALKPLVAFNTAFQVGRMNVEHLALYIHEIVFFTLHFYPCYPFFTKRERGC
jgi:hypothetical protein